MCRMAKLPITSSNCAHYNSGNFGPYFGQFGDLGLMILVDGPRSNRFGRVGHFGAVETYGGWALKACRNFEAAEIEVLAVK